MRHIEHAGEAFTAQELLSALVAERLDRMVDILINRGGYKVGLYGSRRHADWLDAHIDGIANVPMTLYIGGYDPQMPVGTRHKGVDVVGISDERVNELDCVLLSDDRHEDKLFDLATRYVKPGVLIFRLYDRLPIGNLPLPASEEGAACFTESKDTSPMGAIGSDSNRMAGLIAGTAMPV